MSVERSQHSNSIMKDTMSTASNRNHLLSAITSAVTTAVILGVMTAASVRADMYQAPPFPGGVQAQATITSVTPAGTNTSVCWYGMQGWYSVEAQAIGSTNWTSLGRTAASDFAWCLTVPTGPGSNYLFRLNQNNAFVGSGGCAGCHGGQYNAWQTTAHAHAFGVITNEAAQQSLLTRCTVGYGQPTGFVSSNTTPYLENVGCENCHGPAAWHKYSDHSLIRPAVTLASEVCGGCHNQADSPIYSEWTNTLHAVVTPDVANGSSGITNTVNGPNRQMTCGPCHSGVDRLAMLENYESMIANYGTNLIYLTNIYTVRVGTSNVVVTNIVRGTTTVPVPLASDAAKYAVTCAVCHDPHVRERDDQLRNPVFSTNFFTFFTGTTLYTNIVNRWDGTLITNVSYMNNTFASQYNPNVQICAQCHNSRGGIWQGTSRPPHASDQYNILIGSVQTNYLNGTNITMISPHGLNDNGCTQCHMVSEVSPPSAGHNFEMNLDGCTAAGCHFSTFQAWGFMLGLQAETTNKIAQVVALLNQWATNKGPTLFTTNYSKYLQNSWEFTSRGNLSTITNNGPSTADQAKIPDGIKQARYNLYEISGDGSYGVHNPGYARYLLGLAKTNVQTEISKP
jgi:hypothetical protein